MMGCPELGAWAAATLATKLVPAIPVRGGPGRIGPSASHIRLTSISSVPHRRVSPSIWTAMRP
jgi:hypothetical protein